MELLGGNYDAGMAGGGSSIAGWTRNCGVQGTSTA